MKAIFKYLIVFIALLFFGLLVAYFIFNKKLPVGEQTTEADLIALRLQESVNQTALDSTAYIKWVFKDDHKYLYDVKNNFVRLEYDDKMIFLNLNEWEKSKVFENNSLIEGESKAKILDKAYSYYTNDSFWLLAPRDLFNKGIGRRVIRKEGKKSPSLLVHYTSGGVTPGDSYLWNFDDNGQVTDYEMWVSIIPVGGVKASWSDWKTMKTGLRLPSKHKIGSITLNMEPLDAGMTLSELNEDPEVFNILR